MAEIPININGVICDLYGRTITGPVKIVGSMSRTDVGVGGGPIVPPPGGGGAPPGIWPNPPEGTAPHPEHPIVIPPEQVPPDMKPPQTPPPGTATAVPGNWPVAPVVPPEYLVVNYPGVGPLVVVPPPHAEPA